MHTVVFLVRGSNLRTFNISRVIDDFYEDKREEGYCFSGYELGVLERMKTDFDFFEQIVNEAKCDELGYLVAIYSLPYIEDWRRRDV